MIRPRALRKGFWFIGLALIGAFGLGSYHWYMGTGPFSPPKQLLTKDQLAMVLSDSASFYRFPGELELPLLNQEPIQAVVQYAFDPRLQDEMENLFRSYRPDFGAFVAIDATTGRVLSMVSFSEKNKLQDNLALRATFPSASIFKVVTAAAAIEKAKYSADTIISFNGSNHTLYKSNVLKTSHTRWTRSMTLREAFGKSVNTVFGKIGATLGPTELKLYADRFGFNRRIGADFPLQEGRAAIPNDPLDHFELAESASGFTRDNTMSPLQGALIAAAIANDGRMMEPYVVQSVFTQDGAKIYSAEPAIAMQAVDEETALEIRELMKQTITRGTSRKAFHNFFKKKYAALDVGGKTGTLSGNDPKGKYDWFVGYANGGTHKVAFAALAINEKFWRVKASYLARKGMEIYFADKLGEQQIAKLEP